MIFENFRIYQNEKELSKIKEWKKGTFITSIAKFIGMKFYQKFFEYKEKLQKSKKLKIQIDFVDEEEFKNLSKYAIDRSEESDGFFCCSSNTAHVCIDVSKINRLDIEYRLEHLFEVFLHEYKHLEDMFSLFLKDGHGKTLEKVQEIDTHNYRFEMNEITKNKKIEDHMIRDYNRREMLADLFAFENLQTFKNIYKSSGVI